jgi:hypothetical protein
MKKFLVLAALALLFVSAASAQNIDLGNFPKGNWVDANWNAVWEFSTDNIRLLDTSGAVVFDFKEKISDFKIEPGLSGVKISFACKETERKYVFTKGVTDTALTMDIDPDWTDTNYSVKMAFKK